MFETNTEPTKETRDRKASLAAKIHLQTKKIEGLKAKIADAQAEIDQLNNLYRIEELFDLPYQEGLSAATALLAIDPTIMANSRFALWLRKNEQAITDLRRPVGEYLREVA